MISDDLVKKLADIGFMASTSGLRKQAFAIFAGIETAKPKSVLPDIGYALEFINKKKYQHAIALLQRQTLPKDPDNAAVKAFIGLALMLDGHNKECEACLHEIKDSNDGAAIHMANQILEHIHSN